MPKLNNENATFMVIFKHCEHLKSGDLTRFFEAFGKDFFKAKNL